MSHVGRWKVATPRQADFPETRVKVNPAFTHTGIDFAGPLYVKVNSTSAEEIEKMQKSYIAYLLTEHVEQYI